jgi:hypothetical protein
MELPGACGGEGDAVPLWNTRPSDCTATGGETPMGATMTSRERFHATFRFGAPDRAFMMPQWLFGETRQRWLREGLPADQDLSAFFAFDRMEQVPIDAGLLPAVETRVVEQTDHWRIVEDEFGGRVKQWSDREIGMSQWITYPLRGRAQWDEFRRRLDPDVPSRYPEHWADLKRCWAERDYPLGIHAGSLYGWLRNWVGMENLALWYVDCPDLVHEATQHIADFVIRLMERALDGITDLDYAVMWEDMCHKTGPLISPAWFRDFMLPHMKRITNALHAAGIDIIMVDSDGRVDELLPLWLEAGVNFHYPLEVAAGCDPLHYRDLYGRDILLMGAIDKRAMRDGCSKADVEREVLAKVPELWKQGGYSPMVDHAVPPDVPFALFKHYVDLVQDICRS